MDPALLTRTVNGTDVPPRTVAVWKPKVRKSHLEGYARVIQRFHRQRTRARAVKRVKDPTYPLFHIVVTPKVLHAAAVIIQSVYAGYTTRLELSDEAETAMVDKYNRERKMRKIRFKTKHPPAY